MSSRFLSSRNLQDSSYFLSSSRRVEATRKSHSIADTFPSSSFILASFAAIAAVAKLGLLSPLSVNFFDTKELELSRLSSLFFFNCWPLSPLCNALVIGEKVYSPPPSSLPPPSALWVVGGDNSSEGIRWVLYGMSKILLLPSRLMSFLGGSLSAKDIWSSSSDLFLLSWFWRVATGGTTAAFNIFSFCSCSSSCAILSVNSC